MNTHPRTRRRRNETKHSKYTIHVGAVLCKQLVNIYIILHGRNTYVLYTVLRAEQNALYIVAYGLRKRMYAFKTKVK